MRLEIYFAHHDTSWAWTSTNPDLAITGQVYHEHVQSADWTIPLITHGLHLTIGFQEEHKLHGDATQSCCRHVKGPAQCSPTSIMRGRPLLSIPYEGGSPATAAQPPPPTHGSNRPLGVCPTMRASHTGGEGWCTDPVHCKYIVSSGTMN